MWAGCSSRRTLDLRHGGARHCLFGITALAVLLTLVAQPASTQVLFGSEVGNVIDASGASIPGAIVTIRKYRQRFAHGRFGTAGFNTLRGPGNNNLDLGLFRSFSITERFKVQIRGEAINVSNTPHFAVPGANVSNLSLNSDGSVKSLGGFSQIASTNPLSRLIDQRYFRFGFRIIF